MADDPFSGKWWDDFVHHVREDALHKIDESALVVSIAPGAEPDVKFAVELGLSIMLDKPLLVVVLPGRPVPRKLREVADEVIVCDVDTKAGQREIQAAMERVLGRKLDDET
jgi:hypothetical protein